MFSSCSLPRYAAFGSALLTSVGFVLAIGCESDRTVTGAAPAGEQLRAQLSVPAEDRFDLVLEEGSVRVLRSDKPGMLRVEVDLTLYQGVQLVRGGQWMVGVSNCDGGVVGDYAIADRTIWETAENCKKNADGVCESVGTGCPELPGYTSFGCLAHSGCKCKYVKNDTAFDIPEGRVAEGGCLTVTVNPGLELLELDPTNNSITVTL